MAGWVGFERRAIFFLILKPFSKRNLFCFKLKKTFLVILCVCSMGFWRYSWVVLVSRVIGE